MDIFYGFFSLEFRMSKYPKLFRKINFNRVSISRKNYSVIKRKSVS